jgi:hypothetical protein
MSELSARLKLSVCNFVNYCYCRPSFSRLFLFGALGIVVSFKSLTRAYVVPMTRDASDGQEDVTAHLRALPRAFQVMTKWFDQSLGVQHNGGPALDSLVLEGEDMNTSDEVFE